MFSRISGVLFLAYTFSFIAGLGYLISAPQVVGSQGQYTVDISLIGWFYLVGGLVSALATAFRPFLLRKITSLWYFELSGISLLISAYLVHAYSLYIASTVIGEYNLLARASLFISFAIFLSSRVLEVFGLMKYLRQFSTIMGVKTSE